MPGIFSTAEIAQLSAQIDSQLQELQGAAESFSKSGAAPSRDPKQRAPRQWQAIAAAAGEDPEAFWQRFKRAAHRDLCEEGGVLHGQWKKWSDLNNEDVLQSFGTVLVALGFSGGVLQILAMSLAVIVVHLGIKTVCEE